MTKPIYNPKNPIAHRCDANEDCPRYIAFVADSYVEADIDLEELVRLVRQDSLSPGEEGRKYVYVMKLPSK